MSVTNKVIFNGTEYGCNCIQCSPVGIKKDGSLVYFDSQTETHAAIQEKEIESYEHGVYLILPDGTKVYITKFDSIFKSVAFVGKVIGIPELQPSMGVSALIGLDTNEDGSAKTYTINV